MEGSKDCSYMFSVIIPTYNRSKEIQRALDSLVAQTYKQFEVIVCDDGSTENISEVVENFNSRLNLKFIRLDKPSGGPAKPRNKAAELASFEWLCFLDSDDWWYPNKLESLLPYLSSSDLIHHNLDLFVNNVPQNKIITGRSLKFPAFVDLMINHNGILNSGASVRKNIFMECEGFSEIGLEDYDLWLKISRKTENFTFLPIALGAYLDGNDKVTAVSKIEIKRLEKIYLKHVQYLSLSHKRQALAAKRYIQGNIRAKCGQNSLALKSYIFSLMNGTTKIKIKSLLKAGLLLLKRVTK